MPLKPTNEEDTYFKQQELELREKMRRRMAKAAGELQGRGPSESEISQRIHALGFSGENAKVFDILPLVHVAWADGSVSRKERASILALLERRGIIQGSEPFRVIESLLEERPSKEFLSESLALLKEVTQAKAGADIVDWCVDVARASGGVLGLGLGNKVAAEERELIEQIARTLGKEAIYKFRRELG